MKEFIENYEKNSKQIITEDIVYYLCSNIDKAEELKIEYMEVLEKLNKYDNNYYAKICIIINALKFKKSQKNSLNLLYDIYYLNLPISPNLVMRINRDYMKCAIEEKLKLIETE